MFFSCAPNKWFCCISKVQWWFTASRVHVLLQGSSWVHVHSVMPSRNSLRCVLATPPPCTQVDQVCGCVSRLAQVKKSDLCTLRKPTHKN